MNAREQLFDSGLPTNSNVKPTWRGSGWRFPVSWFLRALDRLEVGCLTVVLPDGTSSRFAGRSLSTDLDATLVLNRPRAIYRFLLGGDVAFAESFMDGDWASPDLTALFELADLNRHILEKQTDGSPVLTLLRRLRTLARSNTLTGSRRNIAYHYDLGNAFYELWLDPTMTYSSAYFETEDQSIEAAQIVKYRRIAEMLDLQPGHRMLEIGCGWGGFAEVAAREFQCRVEGITLSREQYDYARRRIFEAGLSERVDLRMMDYRQVEGQYDRIASIEMIEAVGERNWPTYFGTLRDRLNPGGIAVLQAITIADDRFDHYRQHPDFVQEYIFPGGMLPSPSRIRDHAQRQGLRVTAEDAFGPHYAKTLVAWAEKFQEEWPKIESMGFDRRFERMWTYYLAYCEAGFRTGASDVLHLRLERD